MMQLVTTQVSIITNGHFPQNFDEDDDDDEDENYYDKEEDEDSKKDIHGRVQLTACSLSCSLFVQN